MTEDLSQYPAGTILNQMVIDIFANKTKGEITILHDRPFEPDLKELVFDPEYRNLQFVLAGGQIRNFGMPLKGGVAKQMQKAEQVRLFQVNMATKNPVAELVVPLRIESKLNKNS